MSRGGADATISHSLFGVAAVAFGRPSSGSIDVSTGADSTLQAGGTGIFAGNSAFHIPIRAFSTIAVTNNGTINSGALPNPVGRFPSEGGGAVATPAAIVAGYDGRPVFEKHGSGPYTSCGVFGCTTLTPNPKVNGTVSVVNNAIINAAGGNGIFAFNFGNGNVSVTSTGPITATGATAQNGIDAFSAEVGNISVVTAANVTTVSGNGIQTTGLGGNVSIATGAGAIKGATGIDASTKGPGAVTITTGSGLVSGTAGSGISASAANAPLSITIGSGGVTTSSKAHAIRATSTNGNISVTSIGTVGGNFTCVTSLNHFCPAGGTQIFSNGRGNITVDGSGTYSSSGGRAIYAAQRPRGLGGILVTGLGPTLAGTSAYGNASAIRAQIENPKDSSNIVVNRSGDVTSIDTFPADNAESISSDIHALTVGTGNITVAGGAGATLSNAGIFGIETSAFGRASTGSIKVSTGALSTLTTNGTGIFAANAAFAIPASAGSAITVTANGTINSGASLNPVGHFFGDGGGAGATPAGILAGYNGGPVFGPASGPYTSCAYFGCTTLTPNPNVNGAVERRQQCHYQRWRAAMASLPSISATATYR